MKAFPSFGPLSDFHQRQLGGCGDVLRSHSEGVIALLVFAIFFLVALAFIILDLIQDLSGDVFSGLVVVFVEGVNVLVNNSISKFDLSQNIAIATLQLFWIDRLRLPPDKMLHEICRHKDIC